MNFNGDMTARFAVYQNFYSDDSMHFLGGCNDFSEAMGFALGLELDGSNWYSVFDRKTNRRVFTLSENGYGGYGSQEEIDASVEDAADQAPHSASGAGDETRR